MPDKILIQDAKDIILTNHNEIDQILGNPPNWILRWGITLIFVTVIIFGIIAWLIKYPDVITAKVTVSSQNPAIRIVSKTSGKITDLKVNNNARVNKDEIIAIIENPAQLVDIETLSHLLENIQGIKESKRYLYVKPIEKLSLGEIQPNYAELRQKIYDYQYFLRSSGVFKKINSLDDQVGNTNQLSRNLQKQKNRLAQEVKLAESNFIRQKKLNQEGLVSDMVFENSETQFLQYKRQLDNIENQIVNNDIQTENLGIQIIDLENNRMDGRVSRELNIKRDIEQIKGQIQAWKQTYLITAPISGTVSFSKIWNEQQFVRANDVIFTVVPDEGVGDIVGKAILPIANSGKVKKGQAVNIRLDGFPFQEYGVIKSTINNISLVPINIDADNPSSYILEINFPDSLITTYDKMIPFRQEMQGNANIITEDRRVIERIFDRVNSILKN